MPDRIALATRHAASLGVLQGMSISAAQAVCAGLEVRPWDIQCVRHAVHRVSADLLALSPQVTPEHPGTWWIGAGGLRGAARKHAGQPGSSEVRMVAAVRAVGVRWHPGARAGLASSCVAAQAATWLQRPAHVVAGSDQRFLQRVPLCLIPMDAGLRETLGALGLTVAGELAALDPGDVEQRFGPPGLAAWRLARGEDHRRARLLVPVPDDTVELELPVPADTLEPVLFLVRAALGRLVDLARAEGRAIARLDVALRLDLAALALQEGTAQGTPVAITVVMARPLARLEPLYEQCRAALEGVAMPAPVTGLVVRVVERVPARGEQGNLLHTGWRDPAAADAAFARLRAVLGPGTVVRPVMQDRFAPERRGLWDDRAGGTNEAGRTNAAGRAGTPGSGASLASTLPARFRLLHPAESITRDSSTFTWRGRAWPITGQSGLERLSGDWWSDPYARDYCSWDSDGVRFLAYRSNAAWFLQGWWD